MRDRHREFKSFCWALAMTALGCHTVDLDQNQPPSLEGRNITVTAGETVTLPLEAQDPNGNLVEVMVSGWMTGLTRITSCDDVGEHQVHVEVTDGLAWVSQDLTVTVSPPPPPRIQATPPASVVAGTREVVIPLTLTDPSPCATPPLVELESGPEGARVITEPTLALLWSTDRLMPGLYSFTVKSLDSLGQAATTTWEVDVTNSPPAFQSPPPQGVVLVAGQSYRHQPQAFDPDGHALTFWAEGAQNILVDPDSGAVDWQPHWPSDGAEEIALSADLVVADGFGGQDRQTLTMTLINHRPTFTTVFNAASVTLGQTWEIPVQATDQDGHTVTVALASGPEGLTFDASTAMASWTPRAGQEGTYTITFWADDGHGGHVLLEGQVTVTNDTPSFVSVPPTQAHSGETVLYQAQAPDPDGHAVTFRLTDGPDGATLNASTGLFTWTAGAPGAFAVTIIAQDPYGAWADQSFTITVDNLDPFFVTEPRGVTGLGKVYRYDARAQDPEGAQVTYHLIEGPPAMGMTILGQLSWTPGRLDLGGWNVTIEARDGHGGQARQAYGLEVINEPPVFLSIPPAQVLAGEPYHYMIDVHDPEGATPVTLERAMGPLNMALEGKTLTWDTSTARVGETPVILRAQDPYGATADQAFVVTVTNQAPAILSEPLESIAVGYLYRYCPEVDDPDGHVVKLTLVDGPGRMTMTPLGCLEWDTSGEPGRGEVAVAIEASDGHGGRATQGFTVRLTNLSPTFLSQPGAEVVIGRLYTYWPRAEDPEGFSTTITIQSGPPGMTIDGQGVLTWTAALEVGEHRVILRAEDPFDGVGEQAFTLQAINNPPQFISEPPLLVLFDEPYLYQAQANDPEGHVVTYSLDAGPHDMALDGRTGQVEWHPDRRDLGRYVVVIRATDEHGAANTQAYELTVTESTITFLSLPVQVAVVGVTYTYTFEAADLEGDPLTYTLEQAPEGMEMEMVEPEQGVGRLTWTPNREQYLAEVHRVELVATDLPGGTTGEGVQSFTISVLNRLPEFQSEPPPSVLAGEVYEYVIEARDPDGHEVTYGLMEAPPGMLVDPETDTLVWYTTSAQRGAWSVVLVAIDEYGAQAEQLFVVVVENNPPTLEDNALSVMEGQTLEASVPGVDVDGDEISYSLVEGPAGATMDAEGAVVWDTGAAGVAPGVYPMTITMSDGFDTVEVEVALQVLRPQQADPIDPPEEPPPARAGHCAVYQPQFTRMVVFAGYDGGVHNDLILFDMTVDEEEAEWELYEPTGPRPAPRFGSTCAYDEEQSKLYIFGGAFFGIDLEFLILDDVWVLDLSGPDPFFERLPTRGGPAARAFASAVMVPDQGPLIFGGHDGARHYNDLQIFDPQSVSWQAMEATGEPPSPRARHAGVWVDSLGALVVFGGSLEVSLGVSEVYGDLWRLDVTGPAQGTWSEVQLSATPSERNALAMAVAPESQSIMLQGGSNVGGNPLSDVWELHIGAAGLGPFIPLGLVGLQPQARYLHTSVYDPIHRRILAFGGTDGGFYLSDLEAIYLGGR